MAVTGLSQLPPSVRESLPPGEEPLAWQPVDLVEGEKRIGLAGPPQVVTGIDPSPASLAAGGPLVELDEGVFDRLLGGVSLTGHAGSHADRLGQVLSTVGRENWRLAVTTHRVLLYDEGTTTFGQDPATGAKTWDAPCELRWSVSRDAVASARIKSRPLMRGRLLVGFADGSGAALVLGMLSQRGARRVLDALDPTTRGR